MRVPLSWLAEYVPLRMDPTDLAHRLTMAGLETVFEPGSSSNWDQVVVGLVTEVSPHPNADRLQLASVDLGATSRTVVCGAPNIAAGQKVAFAQVGAELHDGKTGDAITLTTAVIRGVESAGMVCSERELGLSGEHMGILVLPQNSPTGAPLADALPSGDALEIEITANRGDCLSVLGVAHEVAAITGETVTEPTLAYEAGPADVSETVSVEITDSDLCYRYTCTVIHDIKVGPSPEWLQRRLKEAGQRPINNVVDVTNYVMLEYGQPLHAFDLDEIQEHKVLVRSATEGEEFTSLDGQRHQLERPMLVIADPKRAIGLAGIMGGLNSEMTEETTSVLLEAATFNAINTRRTAGKLKLRTEASIRFEKGLNPELAARGLLRATKLILETAGGTASRGVFDVFPQKNDPPRISFSHTGLRRVLGVDFAPEQVRQVLDSLGFAITNDDSDRMTVLPPYWRTDVSIEEDVVEEVARTIGYDSVPGAPLLGRLPAKIAQPVRDVREEVRDLLVAAGMQETISHTLVSPESLTSLGEPQAEPLRTANPMSREQEYLRTSIRPNILQSAALAIRQPPGNVALFEVGRIFIPRSGDLPDEREIAIGILAGPRGIPLWEQGSKPLDFFDAKGLVESVTRKLGLEAIFERCEDSMLHSGRSAHIIVNGAKVGVIGELHPKTISAFDMAVETVALFEIDLAQLTPTIPSLRSHFEAFSRYPSAVRDLALIVDATVPAEKLHAIMVEEPLVVRATLFDLFEGRSLPPGKKSLAFRLEIQSTQETLTTEQLSAVISRIVQRLAHEANASLRA